MRRNASLVVLALLLIACAGFAFAQPGGGQGRGPGGPGGPGGGRGPGGPGGPGFMMGGPMMGGPGMGALFSDEGRRDINLSDRQIEEIQTIFRDNMRPGQGGIMPPGPNATDADRQAFMRQMEQRMTDTIGKVEKVMTPEQLKKARERSFQAGGGFASLGMNPFAQAALDIDDSQREKIRGFQREMGEKMRENFERNPPPRPFPEMSPEEREQFGQRMQQFGEEFRKDMEAKIQGILTDAQKKQGEKLLEDTPGYIKQAIENAPRGMGMRGPGGPGGPGGPQQYRPGAESWRPGQGAPPAGDNDTQERRFPRNRNRSN